MNRPTVVLAVAAPLAIAAGFLAGAFVPTLLESSWNASARLDGFGEIATPAAAPSTSVDRTNKSDKLRPTDAAATGQTKIAVVEVVGIRDAAVVYRDRDGRVLFRTDPMANVTVVAKNTALPQVTIRESTTSDVRSVPLQPRPTTRPQEPAPGCDPMVSPHTAPDLSHLLGRCLTARPSSTRLANLR